jgi:hypothetical protein
VVVLIGGVPFGGDLDLDGLGGGGFVHGRNFGDFLDLLGLG